MLPGRLSAAKRTRVVIGVVGALCLAASAFVLVQSLTTRRRLEEQIVQVRRASAQDRRSVRILRAELAEERRRAAADMARHEEETRGRLAALQERERVLKERLAEAESSVADRSREIAELQKKLAANARRIAEVERERTLAERVIREKSGGVAFVEGAYFFVDAGGKPLRLLVEEGGAPRIGPDGLRLLTTAGSGPVFRRAYTGTAFLVSAGGDLLTNRHVAEPWWNDELARELAGKGFAPRLEVLRAYFPSVPDALSLQVVRVSTKADVALVRGDAGALRLPVLEIESEPGKTLPGQPVILIGYPTGLDALVARLDDEIVDPILEAVEGDAERVARELARRRLIRPLATQGHLSDILPNRLTYDASTTLGGSGGPVFNQRGKVIGINAAILPEFGGASFGVPISFAAELLGK